MTVVIGGNIITAFKILRGLKEWNRA